MKKSIPTKPRKIFGYHLALDLYGCDFRTTHDLKKCYQFLDTLPAKIGTNKQAPPFVIYSKLIGFAGWVPIVESGLSLYISFKTNFVSLDIYSCKRFDISETERITTKIFKPDKLKKTFLIRGKEYIHPMELLRTRGLI
jgi:S-adenosylmethionine decarboxylase